MKITKADIVATIIALLLGICLMVITIKKQQNKPEVIENLPVKQFIDCWTEGVSNNAPKATDKDGYPLTKGESYCLVQPQDGWDF